jgi:hypothetical protein
MAVDFEMKDIGMMHYLLGSEIWQKPREIFLRKGKYAIEILKRFWIEDCKSITIPVITLIQLFENLVFHDRSKHIEIMYHFIKDMI